VGGELRARIGREAIFARYVANNYTGGFDAGEAVVKWSWRWFKEMDAYPASFWSAEKRRLAILALQQVIIDAISIGLVANRVSDVQRLRSWWKGERNKYYTMLDERGVRSPMAQLKFEDRVMDVRIARAINAENLKNNRNFLALLLIGFPTRVGSYRLDNREGSPRFHLRSNASCYAASIDYIKNQEHLAAFGFKDDMMERDELLTFGQVEAVESSEDLPLILAKTMRRLALASRESVGADPDKKFALKQLIDTASVFKDYSVQNHAAWAEWYSTCAQYMSTIGSQHGEIAALKHVETLQCAIGNNSAQDDAMKRRKSAWTTPKNVAFNGGDDAVDLFEFLEQTPPSLQKKPKDS
jgi:hypothetical protein